MKIYGFETTTFFSRLFLFLVCVGVIALIITIPVNALSGYATIVKVIVIILAVLVIIGLITSLIKNKYKKK